MWLLHIVYILVSIRNDRSLVSMLYRFPVNLLHLMALCLRLLCMQHLHLRLLRLQHLRDHIQET